MRGPAGPVALMRRRRWRGDPLAAEWTWGLVAVAGLAMVKRYQSFLIAILGRIRNSSSRPKLAVLEAIVSAAGDGGGALAGGLLGVAGGGGDAAGIQDSLSARSSPAPLPLVLGRGHGVAVDARRRADPGEHGGLRGGGEPRPRADPRDFCRTANVRRGCTRWPSWERAGAWTWRGGWLWFCTPIFRRHWDERLTRRKWLAGGAGCEAQAPVLAAGAAVA